MRGFRMMSIQSNPASEEDHHSFRSPRPSIGGALYVELPHSWSVAATSSGSLRAIDSTLTFSPPSPEHEAYRGELRAHLEAAIDAL
jgi:hypothetical protein